MGTVPLDLFVNLWLGLCFAGCAREQLRAGTLPWRREGAAVLSFEGLVMMPVALYFCFAHPDWAWLYTRATAADRSVALAVLVVAANTAALLVGYGGGWVLARDRRDRALGAAVVGALVVALALAVVLERRLRCDASYAGFRAGRCTPPGESRLPWAVALATLGVLAGAAATAYTLWSHGRRYARSLRRDPAAPDPRAESPAAPVDSLAARTESPAAPASAPPAPPPAPDGADDAAAAAPARDGAPSEATDAAPSAARPPIAR